MRTFEHLAAFDVLLVGRGVNLGPRKKVYVGVGVGLLPLKYPNIEREADS